MCPHIASVSRLGSTRLRSALKRSTHWALGALLFTACKTTPLDVVYTVDVAPIVDAGSDAPHDAAPQPDASAGGAGGSAGAAGVAGQCSVVGPGRYVLQARESGLCLGQAGPTTVFGSPAFLLDFAADCQLEARTWQLTDTAVANVFTFQNSLPPYYFLDVETAGIRDGTPVITFAANNIDNQRFEVRPRDASGVELRPQHHPQSCVGVSGASAQIATCDPADPTQVWSLQRADCL